MLAIDHFSQRRPLGGSAVEWFREPLTVVGANQWAPYADEKAAVLASMDVIDNVRPDWDDRAKKIALAIGWAESRFGLAAGGFAFKDGTPSWNWGAMVMTGNAGTILHGDHLPDGAKTTWAFAAWKTPEDGFAAWARMMERPGLAPGLAAMQVGNARGMAEAMYADCLYSSTCPPDCSDAARIDSYAKIIIGSVRHLAPLGDWPPDDVVMGPLAGLKLGKCRWHEAYTGPDKMNTGNPGKSTSGESSSSGIGWVIGAVAVVGGIWLLR